ncbi:MAG: hypothetical protein KatS3mg108_2626 [Isosphaeraceae bacterium]|jgi:hypothetical protein|nr:MAG: hypothetical protein KatS3mg108_2626 [Isosphaeraceae bacterium]
MTRARLLCAALTLAGLGLFNSTKAHAQGFAIGYSNWGYGSGFSINIARGWGYPGWGYGVPVYRPPVVVAPSPVVITPAPVVVTPAVPVWSSWGWGYGGWYGPRPHPRYRRW